MDKEPNKNESGKGEEDENEEGEEEEDDNENEEHKEESSKKGSKHENQSNKNSVQKSTGSKKIIDVAQNHSKVPSQKSSVKSSSNKSSSNKSSKKSKKITIDAGNKNGNLPVFDEFMKNGPEEELNAPSLHYSEKYGKNSQNSQTQKSKKSQAQKSKNSKKLPEIKNANSNLPIFSEYMKFDPDRESYPPSVHYSEKYGKNEKQNKEEKKVQEEKKSLTQKNEGKDLATYEDYLMSDPEMALHFPNINYMQRYGESNVPKEEIQSKKSKKSKITEGSKKSSTLYMFQDYINGDPDKDYKFKEINYNQKYEKSEQQSIKSKKSQKKELIGNVDPERVITTDENEKANIPKLLCSSCSKFPLQPSVCSECKNIFCSECLKDKSKCPKCNSIYKHVDLDEELNKLFSSCRVICTYSPCGCKEQLIPDELLKHEEDCKKNLKNCENCKKEITYEKYIEHYKECKLDFKECEICGYKDTVNEYEKTNKKIEHIKHLLFPEIQNIVKNEVEKAIAAINDSLDKREANKEPKDNKFEEDTMKKLLDIQQLLLNIQPKDFIDKKDDVGLMAKASYLGEDIKNIKLIKTVQNKIDNSFDCNNKFCVIHTFKNDNYIIYPNDNYGINSYNISTEDDLTIIKKAFDSNITCMSSCTNPKKSLTYFAAASYDKSIKVYSVEDRWKKIRTYKDIFDDYSNFSLDFYCSNNQLILLAANKKLKQIKVLYPEESKENEKNLMKYMTHKNEVLCLKHNPVNEEEFFVGTEEGVHMYNIFNLIGEGDDKNKNIEQERDFIDKSEDKAKHVCITFIEEELNYMIEGDSIGIMRVWSIKDGELKKKIKRGILKNEISTLDSWSGRFIIGGTKDGKLIIYDIFDGRALDEFGQHNGEVYCVKVSEYWKYNKIITSCGYDGVIKIWGISDK